MEQHTQSPKRIRQRKFFMVLPLLTLPFLTFLFWSLGGGQLEEASAADDSAGLNLALPQVRMMDEQTLSKMDYYNQAHSDSITFQTLIENDPHYNVMAFDATEEDEPQENDLNEYPSKNQGINSSIYRGIRNNDPNEERVYRKLAQLDEQLNNVDEPEGSHQNATLSGHESDPAVHAADIDRLEQLMQTMNQPDREDEEIQQLNGMLEKILDIQHPDRVLEQLKQTSVERKGEVFAVEDVDHSLSVSSLATPHEMEESNAFYSLDDPVQALGIQNAVQAVIHETQTLVSGATVKLRLLQDIYISGILIPKNEFLFGTAALNGERLMIKIKSIRYQSSLFPVDLSVYDIDGLNGIYIPGAISRDVAKESANRSIQSLGLASLDPSLEAQATNAGIEATKMLFSRKVKLIKVTVKAGYQVLLNDGKQN